MTVLRMRARDIMSEQELIEVRTRVTWKSVVPTQATQSPVHSPTGELVGIIGVSMDITERYQRERQPQSDQVVRRIADHRLVESSLVEHLADGGMSVVLCYQIHVA